MMGNRIEIFDSLWYTVIEKEGDLMPYDGAMKTAFTKLSPEQQTAVYQYVLFLINTPSVEVTIRKEPNTKRKLGLLSDRFRGISEDFNEPLQEFEEYM